MSASAGRVLLIPKGDYNNETAYSVLDWVRYQGASYVCKLPSTGNPPTNTTYWQLMTQDGGGTDENAYHTTDTAETTIDDADYVPFYDTSASAARKSLWSNVKSVLKTYFDTLYSKGHTILNDSGTSLAQQPNLQFKGMDVENDGNNSKTVVTPLTPDYVDAPYNPNTTYTKGMTCISGNKRYRWINSATSTVPAPVPPNVTYWEELSVAAELKQLETETTLWDSGDIAANGWTENYNGTGYWGKGVSLASVYSTLKTALENHRNAYLEVRADSGTYVRYYRGPIYVASDMTIISATVWAFLDRGYSIDFGITSGHNAGYIYLMDNSAGTQRNMTSRVKIITLD